MFEEGPLAAFEHLCVKSFDELAEPALGIRSWTTIGVPIFPPMTFFCALSRDGIIDILDVVVDEEYEWDDPGEEPF